MYYYTPTDQNYTVLDEFDTDVQILLRKYGFRSTRKPLKEIQDQFSAIEELSPSFKWLNIL